MNIRPLRLIALAAALLATVSSALAQGTAFTYQGRLTDNGAAASGTHDFTFTLYAAVSGAATMGVSNVVNDLAVSNGLFTTALDFGAAVFDGSARWLEIATRPGTNTGAYTTLSPRQAITSAPYAIRAANLTGTLPLSQLPAGVVTNNGTGVNLAGSFTGDGANVTNVNAATVGGLSAASLWRITGNPGTTPGTHFLGTTDNQPVEFKANGQRILRLEPNLTSPNVLGGSPANATVGGIVGATVLGGGSAAYPNRVGDNYATVVGGISNTASGSASVAMGQFNTASGYASTALGYSTRAGGFSSLAAGNGVHRWSFKVRHRGW